MEIFYLYGFIFIAQILYYRVINRKQVDPEVVQVDVADTSANINKMVNAPDFILFILDWMWLIIGLFMQERPLFISIMIISVGIVLLALMQGEVNVNIVRWYNVLRFTLAACILCNHYSNFI